MTMSGATDPLFAIASDVTALSKEFGVTAPCIVLLHQTPTDTASMDPTSLALYPPHSLAHIAIGEEAFRRFESYVDPAIIVTDTSKPPPLPSKTELWVGGAREWLEVHRYPPVMQWVAATKPHIFTRRPGFETHVILILPQTFDGY